MHPEIPWQSIIAQRHVLAHEYGDIRQDLIWRVATEHIPILIAQLEALLPPLPPVAESFAEYLPELGPIECGIGSDR